MNTLGFVMFERCTNLVEQHRALLSRCIMSMCVITAVLLLCDSAAVRQCAAMRVVTVCVVYFVMMTLICLLM